MAGETARTAGGPVLATAALFAAKVAADILLSRPLFSISLPKWSKDDEGGSREGRRNFEQRKSDLVKQLLASGIDPLLFDSLLGNEIDRRLKTRFGVAFVVLTFVFTGVSYAIVILNGVYQWKISDVAITGLIIETPLQFIGLLYIIARNLFPDGTRAGRHRISVTRAKGSSKGDAASEMSPNNQHHPAAAAGRRR